MKTMQKRIVHYERKDQYLQMFRLEIQIILEGLVGKIKKEINQ